MFLLLTDETNKEPSDAIRFFIYGGLFIPADKAADIHKGIAAIRVKYGYKDGDLLKFDTNARPAHIDHVTATKAKIEVIDLCFKVGCRFSALVIHHQIAKKENHDQKLLWAANHIIGHFNYFLANEVNDYGICLVDSLPVAAPNQYLAEVFTNGLDIDSQKRVKLDRILLNGTTCINASHLASAIDIILGTFRFCVNSPAQNDKIKGMLFSVAKMMWYRAEGENRYLRERGLIIRPKVIKVPAYQKDYDDLINRLQELLKGL